MENDFELGDFNQSPKKGIRQRYVLPTVEVINERPWSRFSRYGNKPRTFSASPPTFDMENVASASPPEPKFNRRGGIASLFQSDVEHVRVGRRPDPQTREEIRPVITPLDEMIFRLEPDFVRHRQLQMDNETGNDDMNCFYVVY